jgi:DNA modification methylase
MRPAVARQAIAAYSQPGDLVVDPMCGIGTTLVEAIRLGRDAIGTATVITGDARHLPNLLIWPGRSPWC